LSTDKVLYDDPATKALLKPEIVWEIEGSIGMTAERVTEAAISRGEWYEALRKLFESYDILVVPTAQVFPFDATVHWPRSVGGREMDTYHRWMEVVIGGTISGNPVVNVPVGFDEQGRPMGIQCIGRMGQDREVLEFAMAYEAVTDYLDIRPDMVEPTA
jgi:amidase